jgi:predicted kinase
MSKIVVGATYQHINEQVPVVVEAIAQIVDGRIVAYRDEEGDCRALPYEGFAQTFERIDDASLQVILLRGIPGIGKSFYVKQHYPEDAYCSSDLFFLIDGLYVFDQKKLGESHATCMNQFLRFLERRVPVVVVDNTFSRRWEFLNYIWAACQNDYNVKIVELTCKDYELPAIIRRGTHNVPAHIVEDMFHRWEDGDRELLDLPSYYEMRIENQTVEVELPNCWRGYDEQKVRDFFGDHSKLKGRVDLGTSGWGR